jgi:hypothetical protein
LIALLTAAEDSVITAFKSIILTNFKTRQNQNNERLSVFYVFLF